MESIDKLVSEGILSNGVVGKLKESWITDCDALYSRMRACEFSDKPEEMKASMERELEIRSGKFQGITWPTTPRDLVCLPGTAYSNLSAQPA